MSAIAVLFRADAGADSAIVKKMLSAAPHRGSDVLVQSVGSVTVGIARDPEWHRAQLFRSPRFLAAVAGRLDNASSLAASLAYGTPDPNDAAIIAAAFEAWGPECVKRFRGSFAGIVTDGVSLWVFRDHFGCRPLFYARWGGSFFAATEIKQVLAGADLAREPNVDYLQGVVFGGIGTDTAFKGVSRVPKASVLHLDAAGATPRQHDYWPPAWSGVGAARISFEEALEGTRTFLETAVSRVLTGEDAILLSGGLDSPSLAAFAVPPFHTGHPVQAVTSVYPDYPSVDESSWTRMAASHLGMPLHEFVADAGSLDDLEYWVRVVDGPVDTVSIPETAEANRLARSLGARTVINGEIAEMVFESRGFLLDHLLARGRVANALMLQGGLRQVIRRRRWFAGELFRTFAPPAWVTAHRRRNPIPFRAVPGWIDEARLRQVNATSKPFTSTPARDRWRRIQTEWFVGAGIQFEADEICSAVCGVESRRPFADVDLWEFVLSLPAEIKFPDRRTKPLLRAAMRGLLPDELIDRKDKTVFNEFHLAKADYSKLKSLLLEPGFRLEGVDYDLMGERLRQEIMPVWELQWARTLARIHTFLNQW